MTALEAAYSSCRDRMPGVDFPAFEEAMREYDCTPVIVDGAVAGAILTRGPEIHACVLPFAFRRWLSRGLAKRTINELLDRYGYATTHVVSGNEAGKRFVERLGFKRAATSGAITEYRIEASEWALKPH